MNILSGISESVQLMFRRPRRHQYAALCHRRNETTGSTEVLVVTSRDTGRWVLPKGWPMGAKPGHAVAAQEAFEEAGVIGEAEQASLGSYDYEKAMPEGLCLSCQVHVHQLAVQSMASDFKEKGKRQLAWVSPEEAAARVQEPGLKALLRCFAEQVRSGG